MLPSACITPDYCRTIYANYRKSLIDLQIEYFESERAENSHTGEWCETWSKRALMTALGITFVYVVAYLLRGTDPHLKAVATFCGGTLPAIAGALAAIRAYGEYSQHTVRYGNMVYVRCAPRA